MNLRQFLRPALITFGVLMYLNLLGLPLTLGAPAVTLFAFVVGVFSFVFLRRSAETDGSIPVSLLGGLFIGLFNGIGIALVTTIFASYQAAGKRVNEIFAQVLPEHTGALTGLTKAEVLGGADIIPGLSKLLIFFSLAGLLGGGISYLISKRPSRQSGTESASLVRHWVTMALPFLFFGLFMLLKIEGIEIGGSEENVLGLFLVFLFIGASLFAFREAETGREKIALSLVLLVLIIILPQLTDLFQNAVLGAVAIFIVMGLGLNVVVGYAGLLDLGYVAFFGIGAYTFALLSAPQSYVVLNLPAFGGLTFWSGLPVAIIVGIFAGILLGIPVLRMRGDYLAIVTLGFGEIIRLLFVNLRDYTGGPGGVLNLPSPIIFGFDLGNPKGILYLGMIFAAIVAFLTMRLRDSRLGRAWIAMREDEDVAQAMGINLVSIKLLAFATGAAFAAGAGALYASRQVNIFPDNFTLLVSIRVLSLIIIGGIGSFEGVVLGSIALIGLPEVLRSVDEYRIVAFGFLLIVMMILRPEGLLPSARRQRELHTDDATEVSASAD